MSGLNKFLITIFALTIIPGFAAFISYRTTLGFFNDSETSVNNVFAAAETFPSGTVKGSAEVSAPPSSSSCCPCPGGSALISGNGPGSTNTININQNCETNVNQNNNTNVTINVT